MAEYALKHPLVWLVHFPFTVHTQTQTQTQTQSQTQERREQTVVEEGVILNVKYSLKAGNALVIFCPKRDVIVELPLKTIIRKIQKVDITPYYPKIQESFAKNKDHISVNTKRLLRVSLSIADEKITAASLRAMHDDDNGDSEEDEEEEEEDEDEEEEEEEDESSSESSEEEEDFTVDFKVDIQSPNGSEVRGG